MGFSFKMPPFWLPGWQSTSSSLPYFQSGQSGRGGMHWEGPYCSACPLQGQEPALLGRSSTRKWVQAPSELDRAAQDLLLHAAGVSPHLATDRARRSCAALCNLSSSKHQIMQRAKQARKLKTKQGGRLKWAVHWVEARYAKGHEV